MGEAGGQHSHLLEASWQHLDEELPGWQKWSRGQPGFDVIDQQGVLGDAADQRLYGQQSGEDVRQLRAWQQEGGGAPGAVVQELQQVV